MARSRSKKSKLEKLVLDLSEEGEVNRGVAETVNLEVARGCEFERKPLLRRVSQMDMLKRSGRITWHQYTAGEIYGSIYKIAHFVGKYPCALVRLIDGDHVIRTLRGLAAMKSVARAKAWVGEDDLVLVLDDVCGRDQKLNKGNELLLIEALERLCGLYFGGERRYKGNVNRNGSVAHNRSNIGMLNGGLHGNPATEAS